MYTRNSSWPCVESIECGKPPSSAEKTPKLVTLFGVAILSRDGALMLLAFALSALAFYILVFVSPLLSWLGLG